MKKYYSIFFAVLFSLTFISCDNQDDTEDTSKTEVKRKRNIKKIGTYKNLTAIEFKEKLNSSPGTILDVRELVDVKRGVIEGAVIAPLYADNFQEVINTLQKDIPIYVYDGSGNLSVIAAKTLLSNEFSEIYGLMGGITAWGMEGYKTVNPKIIKGKF
jgi:rhodanese-related sulfurtransferase